MASCGAGIRAKGQGPPSPCKTGILNSVWTLVVWRLSSVMGMGADVDFQKPGLLEGG